MDLTLLPQAQIPFKYWWEAFSTFVFLFNRLPFITLDHLSPFQMIFKSKPNFHSLKVFGCDRLPYLRPYNKHNFDFHTSKCGFIGYNQNHKGYRCLQSFDHVYVARKVNFNE